MEKSSFKIKKDNFLANFFAKKELVEYRKKAIRRTFLFLSLIFFLSYYFIGVGFYKEFFSYIIPKVYFLFVVVGIILSFLIAGEYIKNKFFKILVNILFIIIGIIFVLPIFIKKEFILSLFN